MPPRSGVSMRILVVEDDIPLADAVVQVLKRENFSVDAVHDGESGLAYASEGLYDLMVLDVMLPKMDGFSVLAELRKEGSELPILMLTAKAEVSDRVEGLNLGADDYLPKPFAIDELKARVHALLRRRDRSMISERPSFGDLLLDTSSLKLKCAEKEIQLTAKEFELFEYFMLRKGMITPKEMIIDKLWGYDGEAVDNNVEVYVSFLRRKLKFLNSQVTIKTTRGVGYSMEE